MLGETFGTDQFLYELLVWHVPHNFPSLWALPVFLSKSSEIYNFDKFTTSYNTELTYCCDHGCK